MADRSIVARLRADVSDLTSKLRQGQTEIRNTARVAEQANKTTAASALTAAEAEKVRAATRTQTAVAEVRASEQQVLAAQKYGKVTAAVTQHKDTLDKLGRGFTLVGLAAGAGLAAAVSSAANFDQAMSNVAATGSDARDNIGQLRDAAIKAGAATKYSATEAAEGVESLLKAGVSASDVLGGGLSGALNLAAAGNQSVGESAETAASLMNQFGLKGSDVTHVADLLAQGAGTASGEVSDLSMALRQSGGVANQYGLSVDQTVESLALFAKQGYIGSDAGTSFKTMLQSLYAPIGTGAKALDQLGVSAYDANGKIKDIGPLADELNAALSHLSEGDRNQVLSQIFGSDAIRVAPILLKAGSRGLAEMGSEFQHFGTAAEVAGAKMDNLKGDLEQLKGSFETALIGAGSGGTKVLRELTQAATKVVNGFNGMPESSQHVALLGTAILSAAGLGVGGLIKLATTAAATKTALAELGVADKTVSRIGTLSKTVGVLGLALAAIPVATAINNINVKPAQISSVSEAASAILALSKAADGSTAALDGLFTTASHRQIGSLFGGDLGAKTTALTGNVHDLDSAFASLGHRNWNQQLEDKVEGLVGYQGDFARLTGAISTLDQGLVQLGQTNPAAAASSFKTIEDAAQRQGVSLDDLVNKYFPQYKASLLDQANQLNVTGLSAQDYAGWMAGIVPPAIAAAQANKAVGASASTLGDSTSTAVTGVAALSSAIGLVSAPATVATGDLSKLAGSLFSEGDAVQSGVAAHSSYAAALDAASAALKKNGDYTNRSRTALSDNTAKGRENIQVLNDLSSSGKAYVQSLVAQGAGADKAASATASVRKQFVKTAESAGLTKKAANELADSYGLIPGNVSTKIETFGLAAQQAQVTDYAARLNALPAKKRAEVIATYNSKGAKAALAQLDSLDHKTAKPRILTQSDAKKVSSDAQRFLNAIKDGKPGVKTQSDAKRVTSQAQAFLKSIKDVDPKVLTKKDLTAAAAARAYLASIKDKPVTVKVSATGVGAAQSAINSIHGKSVPITIHSTTIRSVKTVTAIANATGGPITGPGTGTSDDVPVWASNGEFMQRTAAVQKYGLGFMHAVNSLSFPTAAAQGYAKGGPIGYATGGLVASSVSDPTLRRLIAELESPLGQIASAAAAVVRSQQAAAPLLRSQASARAVVDRANGTYAADVRTRDRLRTQNTAEVAREKARIALLTKRAAATKGVTAADRQLTAERAKLAKIERDYSVTSRKASDRVTADATAKSKANDAYAAASDRAKTATDNLKAAQDQLVQQQQAVVDAAQQVSSSLVSTYQSKTTDVTDFIALRKQGTADLLKLNAELVALRRRGLNEGDIQQILSLQQERGAPAAQDVVDQINRGGSKTISQLNAAASSLQNAADAIALTAAKGVQRKAAGGLIGGYGTGTQDNVPLWSSAGEFMQPKAAVDHYGVPMMQAIQHLRFVPQQAPAVHPMAGGVRVEVRIDRLDGGDPNKVARAVYNRFGDAMASAGLTAAPVAG